MKGQSSQCTTNRPINPARPCGIRHYLWPGRPLAVMLTSRDFTKSRKSNNAWTVTDTWTVTMDNENKTGLVIQNKSWSFMLAAPSSHFEIQWLDESEKRPETCERSGIRKKLQWTINKKPGSAFQNPSWPLTREASGDHFGITWLHERWKQKLVNGDSYMKISNGRPK